MAGQFTTGVSISLVIQTPNGVLDISDGITDFNASPKFNDIESKRLGGLKDHVTLPDGHEGTFKFDRLNAVADAYFCKLEADYFDKGILPPNGSIYQTVKESDGSVTQWRYTNVTLKLTEAGNYSGDKKVEQTISFKATRKMKVS